MTDSAHHRGYTPENCPGHIRVVERKEILETTPAPTDNDDINIPIYPLQGSHDLQVCVIPLHGSRRDHQFNREPPGNYILDVLENGTGIRSDYSNSCGKPAERSLSISRKNPLCSE